MEEVRSEAPGTKQKSNSATTRQTPSLKIVDRPAYGAVAVGRWVEFYRYNRNAVAGQDTLQFFRLSLGNYTTEISHMASFFFGRYEMKEGHARYQALLLLTSC